jgi:hypothetical protein
MQNRVFFPQAALDEWIVAGSIDLQGIELTILAEGRRYRLAEAVHIAREVTGSPDANEVVGKVKSIAYLQELGAELVETSMILGENAYDVVPGWMGTPVGSFDEYVASPARAEARARFAFSAEEPRTDEDLLARFIVKSL